MSGMQIKPYQLTFFIAMLALLSGCITVPKMAKYNSNIDNKYPPISVFYAEPSQQLRDECLAFDNESILQYCRENKVSRNTYVLGLREAQLFEEVFYANKDNPFQLEIAAVDLQAEEASDFLKGAISGASLMLIPLQQAHEVKVEMSLYFYDRKIKKYTYQLPYVTTHSLFRSATGGEYDFVQLWASHFIRDLQKDDVFSSKAIAAALQSTDYSQGLNVPKKIGDFLLAKQFSYYDPFLGHQSTYVHPDFSDDYIDLFVYPIRQVDLQQSNDVLRKESSFIQNEITAIANKSQWRDLSFSPLKPVNYSKNGKRFNGVGFDIQYTNTLGEQKFSGLYLFQMGDKLIKWRTSFPAKLVEQALLFQMWDIVVPEESLFMATFRQQWRLQAEENEINTKD